jgi:homoserine dehydrogenase
MGELGSFLSVGYGGVGQAVPERVTDLGLEHSRFLIRSTHIDVRMPDGSVDTHDETGAFWEDEQVMAGVEAAFVAIPSDQADRELEIIERLAERGVKVVTAAKGAVAGHFEELEPNFGNLGISATVGGGTRMLPWLSDRLDPRFTQLHAVVNGTLNYIMHGIGQGETSGQMIDQAGTLKFAEPGATSKLDVLNGEAVGDIPKKTAILWNVALRPVFAPDTIISPEDIKQPALTEDDLDNLIGEADSRRYILSIMRDGKEKLESDVIAGFRTEIAEGWVIKGGFRRIGDNPLFRRNLDLPGPWNGIVMSAGANESDGVYAIAGPGAGPGPTAAAMAQDARQLLRAA